MKKLNLRVSSMIIAAFVSVAILGSCKKECTTCVPQEPDARETIVFNLMEKSLSSEYSILKLNIEENYRESGFRKPDETLFQFFKEYCTSKNITIGDQAFAFVLYYDAPITQLLTVIDENIKGIGIYCIEGKKIIHHLFVRNENAEFCEIENVKLPVPGIYGGYIDFYLKNYVFTDIQNKSDIIITGNYAIDVEKNSKKYKHTPFVYEIKSTVKKPLSTNLSGCQLDSRCPAMSAGNCEYHSGYGQYMCSNTIYPCAANVMMTALEKENSAVSKFLKLDLMYSFRDNFLYKYKKGEEYIGNYYYLSDEWKEGISISLAIKSALFFKDFNPVMEAFVNPDKHEKEIMFTDELSNSLFALLDEYEKITKTSEGKAILKSIRNDVNSFKNKPLEDILAMIK